ncbi:MAG: DNA-processing protein DprA, partial [Armatimonadota bacterium]
MADEDASQYEAWLLLNASGLTARRQRELLEALGSPDAILGADNQRLQDVEGITASHVRKIRAAQAEIDPAGIRQMLDELHAHLVPITDERYPKLLRETDDPPPLLYVRGELTSHDELAVAMVGTRKRSPYGEQVAELRKV